MPSLSQKLRELKFNIVEPPIERFLPNDSSLFNYKFKNTAGTIRPISTAMNYRSFFYENYTDPVKFTEENVMVSLYGILMAKHNIFFQTISKKISTTRGKWNHQHYTWTILF